MGLDTTHDCWHGPYSMFGRFRKALAEAGGYPPLGDMVGFNRFGTDGGLSWEPFSDDPLTTLLNHSDCDGDIAWAEAADIAQRLEALAPVLRQRAEADSDSDDWSDDAVRFAAGLRRAVELREDVEFH